MISSVARSWFWPDPIEVLPDLLDAMRAGFELKQLPPRHSSDREVRYAMFRDGHRAPPDVLVPSIVQRAIRERHVDVAERYENGLILFKVVERRRSINRPE